MHLFRGAAAASAAALLATASYAQPASCSSSGVANAVPITVDSNNPGSMAGVLVSAMFLSDDQTSKVTREIACTRGSPIAVGQATFTLTGEDGDAFPRRVVPSTQQAPLFYIAVIPDLGLNDPTAPRAKTALITLDDQGAMLWRLYTDTPSDDLLRGEVTSILTGGHRPLAAMRRGTKQLQIMMPAAAGQAPLVASAPQPRTITAPDGVIFKDAGAGAARHAATGFPCPASIGPLKRRNMVIYDPAQDGRDVSCGYGEGAEGATFTFYLTKIAEQNDALFARTLQDLKSVRGGADGDVASPVETGARPLPTSAAFWRYTGARGIDGIAMSKIGDWSVKLRISYVPGAEPVVRAMTTGLFGAAYQQIAPVAP